MRLARLVVCCMILQRKSHVELVMRINEVLQASKTVWTLDDCLLILSKYFKDITGGSFAPTFDLAILIAHSLLYISSNERDQIVYPSQTLWSKNEVSAGELPGSRQVAPFENLAS